MPRLPPPCRFALRVAAVVTGLSLSPPICVAGTSSEPQSPRRPAKISVEDNMRVGRALIAEAERGSNSAAERAEAIYRSVLAEQPDYALARAWLGVSIVLQARDASMTRKRQLAADGFREIDAAVQTAPEDCHVRLVRAINASQLPLILGRRDIAAEDFTWLLVKTRDMKSADPSLRRQVLYRAGSFALKERRPQAIALLEEALATNAVEPTDEQVQSMLALARSQFTPPTHADR